VAGGGRRERRRDEEREVRFEYWEALEKYLMPSKLAKISHRNANMCQ
jgi:hypothetical protein